MLDSICVYQMLLLMTFSLIFNFFYLRAGGEDSAFSNSSIILQLREQVSQLQGILQEKEESEKTAVQKLAMYQNQLHAKNNEVSTLKDQIQAQVCLVVKSFSVHLPFFSSALRGEYVAYNVFNKIISVITAQEKAAYNLYLVSLSNHAMNKKETVT